MKLEPIVIIIAGISLVIFIAHANKNNGSLKNQELISSTSSHQADSILINSVSANPNRQIQSVSSEYSSTDPFKAGEFKAKTKKLSLKQLAGPVHNEFGIRDDIYAYIQKTIPVTNSIAMKAAITYAAQIQFIYYKSSEGEILEASKKIFIALRCLRKSKHSEDPIAITGIIDNMMKNTKERENHMWEIADHLFSWKILGTHDMTSADIEKVCVSGDY